MVGNWTPLWHHLGNLETTLHVRYFEAACKILEHHSGQHGDKFGTTMMYETTLEQVGTRLCAFFLNWRAWYLPNKLGSRSGQICLFTKNTKLYNVHLTKLGAVAICEFNSEYKNFTTDNQNSALSSKWLNILYDKYSTSSMAEYFLCAKKLRQFFPYAICYMPPILIYIAVSGLPEHCTIFHFPSSDRPSVRSSRAWHINLPR